MPIWVLAAVTILAAVGLDFSVVSELGCWLSAGVIRRIGDSRVMSNFFMIDGYVGYWWIFSFFSD